MDGLTCEVENGKGNIAVNISQVDISSKIKWRVILGVGKTHLCYTRKDWGRIFPYSRVQYK